MPPSQTEATNAASLAQLGRLLALSTDWYWEQDAAHRVTRIEAGAAAERVGSAWRDAVIGRCSWDIPGLEPLDGDWAPPKATMASHLPFRDLLLKRANDRGETRYVSVSGEPRFDAAGRFLGYYGITRDITERVVVEWALKESEALNRAVINSLHEGVFVRDRDETFIACNASAERMFGLRAAQILGRKTLVGLVGYLREDGTPADAFRPRIGLRSLREGASESGIVFGVVRPDGTRVWISANSQPIVYPGEAQVRGAVISFGDITEQREAENSLRASQAANRMLAKALQQSTDAIYTKDLDGIVTNWNAGCERLFGYSAQEAIGKSVYELQMRLITGEEWKQHLAKRIQSGRPRELEAIRLAKDGRKVLAALVVSPLFDEEGRHVGEVCNARDMTELRRAQSEVEQLNRELESRVAERTAELGAVNRELEAFCYSVSHDLRAPLRSINGFSDMLAERMAPQLDAESRDQLHRVRTAAQRMGALIEDLLKLSRVARGEIRRQEVDLSGLAEAIVAELSKEAPARRFELRVEPGLKAHADLGLMRILMENLLGNAWKFTGKRELARIEFGAVRGSGAGQSEFYVRDNGAGFDMAYADRLFSPFQRLHAVDEFEGTGIGLATVQRIVRRHGGRIRVESGVDAGTTFFLVV